MVNQKRLAVISLSAVFMIIFLSVLASATSVTTTLFFDTTSSNSLQITNGQSAGFVVSADSAILPLSSIKVDFSGSGGVSENILSVSTTHDQYPNSALDASHFIIGPADYKGPGNYIITSEAVSSNGDTATDTLFLTVTPIINPIPEFGVWAGALTLVGAIGVFLFIRRR